VFSEETFNKLIQPLKRKVFLLIGRAILTAVNNSEKFMKVQVTALKDETITDIERVQEYGFETYPKKDAEAFIVFPNGNRDQG
jgi:phage gp45-like